MDCTTVSKSVVMVPLLLRKAIILSIGSISKCCDIDVCKSKLIFNKSQAKHDTCRNMHCSLLVLHAGCTIAQILGGLLRHFGVNLNLLEDN